MKELKFLLTLAYVFVIYGAFAQQKYIRNTAINTEACGLRPDSTYQWWYEDGYVQSGIPAEEYESMRYYWYDGRGRVVREEDRGGPSNDLVYLWFYNQHTVGSDADSMVRYQLQYPQFTTSFSYKCIADSLLHRWNRYEADSLVIYGDIEYINDGKFLTAKETWSKILNKVPVKDTIGYARAMHQNGKLKEYEELYGNTWNGKTNFRRRYEYNGDTIINFTKDSSIQYWLEDTIIKRDFNGGLNSSFSIKKSMGVYTVMESKRIYRNYFSSLDSSNEETQTLDTIFQNGSYIRYLYSDSAKTYLKNSKHEITQDGWVNYAFKKGRWFPSQKLSNYYLDEAKKCLGSTYFYKWVDNSWKLYNQSVKYYGGQTNLGKNPNPTCNLPNPFSYWFALACEALQTNEKYTLTVYDMNGSLSLQRDFKMDQTLEELSSLKPSKLYFFVITNSNGDLVSKQKILMQY